MISNRAKQLISSPSVIMEGYLECLTNPFHDDNPAGYLNFGVAENYLNNDLLLPQINQCLSLTADLIQYNAINGSLAVRSLMANFMERFLNLKNVEPEKIVFNCGLSSVCESLSFSLFNPGDKILIPTPYYSGFEHDFTKRFKCQLIPVHLDHQQNFQHQISPFQEAIANHSDAKAVLITHPHNPSGEVLDIDFFEDITQFCIHHDLQLICDEIYALSSHTHQKHHSLYQYAVEQGVKAHFLYGLAKDFCLAGLKIGIYYTNNDQALSAIQAGSYFYPISSLNYLVLENIFKDHAFLTSYLSESQKRLNQTKQKIITALPKYRFLPAESGIFLILDLSAWCDSFSDELRYHQLLLKQCKINLTPGTAMGMHQPGFFRVCYARDERQVDEFISRMKAVYSLL